MFLVDFDAGIFGDVPFSNLFEYMSFFPLQFLLLHSLWDAVSAGRANNGLEMKAQHVTSYIYIIHNIWHLL